MDAKDKDALTKRIALQLQIALTAWHELYPDDSDEDACDKSLEIVQNDLEEILTRPDLPPVVAGGEPAVVAVEPAPIPVVTPPLAALEVPAPPPRPSSPPPPRFAPRSLRAMVIEIAREYPGGFDISTAIEEAEAQGWSHAQPRNAISIVASTLVRDGLLVRQDRGMYALSGAFMGIEGDDAP